MDLCEKNSKLQYPNKCWIFLIVIYRNNHNRSVDKSSETKQQVFLFNLCAIFQRMLELFCAHFEYLQRYAHLKYSTLTNVYKVSCQLFLLHLLNFHFQSVLVRAQKDVRTRKSSCVNARGIRTAV